MNRAMSWPELALSDTVLRNSVRLPQSVANTSAAMMTMSGSSRATKVLTVMTGSSGNVVAALRMRVQYNLHWPFAHAA